MSDTAPAATPLVDLADLPAGESAAKARGALDRYRLRRPVHSRDPVFQSAFSLLHDYFGPLGEIERPEVLAAWADAPLRQLGHLTVSYSMVLAEDDQGEGSSS